MSQEVDDEEVRTGIPGRIPLLLALFFVLVVVGGTADLLLDRPPTLFSWHVLFEGTMIVLSLGFAVFLFSVWRRTSAALRRAQRSLVVSRRDQAEQARERDDWRRRAEEALTRLSTAIDQQFSAWRLTPAEREVALLLLKGDGHKQAAARLGRSERTVRQQAVDVYRKAGLQGRAELAAFFLRDLELPSRDDVIDGEPPPIGSGGQAGGATT